MSMQELKVLLDRAERLAEERMLRISELEKLIKTYGTAGTTAII